MTWHFETNHLFYTFKKKIREISQKKKSCNTNSVENSKCSISNGYFSSLKNNFFRISTISRKNEMICFLDILLS